MKLATKTITLLIAIVSTVLVSTGFFLLRYQEESLKRSIIDGLEGQAHLAASNIETFIGDRVRETEAIAASFPALAFQMENVGQVESYLQKMSESYPAFGGGLFVLELNGGFFADFPLHPQLRGESFVDREYYRQTIRENRGVISNPYRSMRTGLPVLTFTALIRDMQNQAVAILGCSLDLLSEQALGGYRMQQYGKTGYLYIFDKSRLLVLHPDDKRLLTHGDPGGNRLLESALSGFPGSVETVDSQGISILLSVVRIPVTDWMVAVRVPQAEAYAPIARTRLRFFLLIGGVLALVASVGAVAIRRITLPLRQLESMAVRISEDLAGSEEKRTFAADSVLEGLARIRTGDEIGLLASAFSRLVMTLDRALGSLQRSVETWQHTFDSVNEGVVILDGEGRIMRMNRAAEDWFKTSARKVGGQYGYRVIFGTDVPPADWPDISSLEKHQRVRWSERLANPSGIFEFRIYAVAGPEGKAGAILIIHDITEVVEAEERIRQMAFFDQLTGLPNRFLLRDRFQQAAAAAERAGRRVGVMFIDLDKFKEVNDRLGHDAGDEVLRQVSCRISECLRRRDTLSRMGGDEFVAILCDIENRSEVGVVAERITEVQAVPLKIDRQPVATGSSIGIAFYPDDGEDLEALLKKADTAMYAAKAGGRNRYRYYNGGTTQEPDGL